MLAVVGAGHNPATTPVRQWMLTPAPTLHQGDSLAMALALMSRTTLPGLPVLDAYGHPCGFLSRQRLAQAPMPQPEGPGALNPEPDSSCPGWGCGLSAVSSLCLGLSSPDQN